MSIQNFNWKKHPRKSGNTKKLSQKDDNLPYKYRHKRNGSRTVRPKINENIHNFLIKVTYVAQAS